MGYYHSKKFNGDRNGGSGIDKIIENEEYHSIKYLPAFIFIFFPSMIIRILTVSPPSLSLLHSLYRLLSRIFAFV